MTKILIGCDPEVFIQNPNSGQFIGADGLIQGSKYNPFPVQNGAVQVDGMAAEFNIDPAHTAADFSANIKSVMAQMAAMVPGYNLVVVPTVHFDEEYFASVHPRCKEGGCDPDFNAWTECVNMPPDMMQSMRTGAGHIHIGFTENKDVNEDNHFLECAAMAREMDYYIGIYSLLWDSDSSRRSMYGRAGCFRPKPYGVEYRTPSNAWLRDDRLINWVYNSSKRCVENVLSGKSIQGQFDGLAQRIIDESVYDWPTVFPELLHIDVPRFPYQAAKKALAA